jgi:3',5'-cyclic AMP phosphodiesterase CpdA
MRILVVSDLHYRLPHYDWLLEAAGTVDAVVIAGDLADVVSPVPHEVQTVVISRYLGQLAERTTVLAASGNHDLDGPGPHGEQMAAWLRRTGNPALATSTSRRGRPAAPGTPDRAGRGSSTPASRSARFRRTSHSTPRRGRPAGTACSSPRR